MNDTLGKITIFILDDDRYYGLFLKNTLRNDNYDIHYFQHEQECIQKLNTIPEILILDHKLEFSTGLEVLDEVNRQCNGKTKVIYLSGQEHVHVALQALKAGAVTYVEKTGEAIEVLNTALDHLVNLTNNFKNKLDLDVFRKRVLKSNQVF